MADVKILTPQERLADPVIYADILRRVRQAVAITLCLYTEAATVTDRLWLHYGMTVIAYPSLTRQCA